MGEFWRNRNQATNKKKQSHELNGLLCEFCVLLLFWCCLFEMGCILWRYVKIASVRDGCSIFAGPDFDWCLFHWKTKSLWCLFQMMPTMGFNLLLSHTHMFGGKKLHYAWILRMHFRCCAANSSWVFLHLGHPTKLLRHPFFSPSIFYGTVTFVEAPLNRTDCWKWSNWPTAAETFQDNSGKDFEMAMWPGNHSTEE